MDIAVRAARSEDHQSLQRIFRRAALSNPDDREALLAHPEFLRLDPDLIGRGRTLVATVTDQTSIGFASTRVTSDGVLELDDLFVDPDWRRHGAARRLVERIAAEAADEQVVRLDVIANEHAMEFYLAIGFESEAPAATPLGVGIRMHLNIPNAARPQG